MSQESIFFHFVQNMFYIFQILFPILIITILIKVIITFVLRYKGSSLFFDYLLFFYTTKKIKLADAKSQ